MTDWLPLFFDSALLMAAGFSLFHLTTIGRHLMATQSDVDKLTAQVGKIGDEVKAAHAVLVSELADVKAQLAAAGAAEQIDLTGLAAAIQNVDDINPDPEPAAEETTDDQPVEEAPPF